MSLFKILKGEQQRLPAQNIHEGWAYFTQDTGNFYIDTADQRIKINPKSKAFELTISPSDWTTERQPNGYFITITNSPVNLNLYTGTIGISNEYYMTSESLAEVTYYQIRLLSVDGDTNLTLGAARKPTTPVKLMLTLTPKEDAILN